MKYLIQGRSNPFHVTDRAAMLLVGPDVQTVRDIIIMVQDIVEDAGGKILTPLESNLLFDYTEEVDIDSIDADDETDEEFSADLDNPDSSKDFKVAKFDFEYHGRRFEIQFMTFADYYSGLLATNDVGHPIYKLSQAYKYHLPFRFPFAIYRINWAGEEERKMLRSWKQRQLGWCVKHNPPH